MLNISKIQDALIGAGSAAVGITRATDLPEVESLILSRSSGGYLAEMDWLGKTAHLRTHPSMRPDGTGLLICSIWPYSQKKVSKYFARYALCVDYHSYILDKLQVVWSGALGREANALFFVDSMPLAEKAYAARAGLGWIGKNSLLVSPDIGSFFCLGFILTDLECRAQDLQLRNDNACGDCTKCIDACPTGAITGPGLIDCKRCISYLTTEHKGEISIDLRPLMGTNLFGCDICQEVCPYNDKPFLGSAIPSRGIEINSLDKLMLLSEGDFKEMFDGTPVVRIGRERFLRNVSTVLGNVDSPGPTSFY